MDYTLCVPCLLGLEGPIAGELRHMKMENVAAENGRVYFPDAPTQRGVRHLHELSRAAAEGVHALLAFVIQMDHVAQVRPNTQTHPEFGQALEAAGQAGVRILYLPCHVEPDSLTVLPETPWPDE